MNITNYLRDKILTDVFVTPNVYIALYLTEPQPDGSGTEMVGSNYIRQNINFRLEGGILVNSDDIEFPFAADNWGVMSHIAIFDAETGGNMLVPGLLTPKAQVLKDTKLIIETNTISISILD